MAATRTLGRPIYARNQRTFRAGRLRAHEGASRQAGMQKAQERKRAGARLDGGAEKLRAAIRLSGYGAHAPRAFAGLNPCASLWPEKLAKVEKRVSGYPVSQELGCLSGVIRLKITDQPGGLPAMKRVVLIGLDPATV
ncbi:MAG TPA: hypothetical protein VNE63_08810, partial [Candidatus Acidoferrales bacterium]|nr:hypothetical protein [Candidatus Acidoferrales bacterium]